MSQRLLQTGYRLIPTMSSVRAWSTNQPRSSSEAPWCRSRPAPPPPPWGGGPPPPPPAVACCDAGLVERRVGVDAALVALGNACRVLRHVVGEVRVQEGPLHPGRHPIMDEVDDGI